MDTIKKIRSLLKFYFKERTSIKLKIKNKQNIWITGQIQELHPYIWPYVVVGKTKIFFEDIEEDSILPETISPPEGYSDRKSKISRRKRYEVLKRDNFSCQKCGAGAEATLEVDHINPISKGGTDEMINLQTLCKSCNLGKGDRE